MPMPLRNDRCKLFINRKQIFVICKSGWLCQSWIDVDLWVFQGIFGVKGGPITYLQILALILKGKKGGPPQESLASPYVLFLMKVIPTYSQRLSSC